MRRRLVALRSSRGAVRAVSLALGLMVLSFAPAPTIARDRLPAAVLPSSPATSQALSSAASPGTSLKSSPTAAPSSAAAPSTAAALCPPGFGALQGTQTCVRISGRVRAESLIGPARTRLSDGFGTQASGRIQLDVRTRTEYGPLRAVIRAEGRR
jgi:hypothetical protein